MHKSSWRAVWSASRRRFVRDNQTLNLQRNRALAVVGGEKTTKKPRFVKETKGKADFDQATFDRAVALAGLKGYVTNIPRAIMSAKEVIASYHDLWHVEQSFRMSKTDLRARPIFHRTKDGTDAHLTIVFAALAVSRYMYSKTGTTAPKIVEILRPIQEVTMTIAGHPHTGTTPLTAEAERLVSALTKATTVTH